MSVWRLILGSACLLAIGTTLGALVAYATDGGEAVSVVVGFGVGWSFAPAVFYWAERR